MDEPLDNQAVPPVPPIDAEALARLEQEVRGTLEQAGASPAAAPVPPVPPPAAAPALSFSQEQEVRSTLAQVGAPQPELPAASQQSPKTPEAKPFSEIFPGVTPPTDIKGWAELMDLLHEMRQTIRDLVTAITVMGSQR